MSMSAEQIEALADAVAVWRMQEYLAIAFYCLYVHSIVVTMTEEVSIIFPQRWNRGKMLYAIIRYGMLAAMALQLSRDYRNYFSISPMACKALFVTIDAIRSTALLACDFSLALCLGALLEAKLIYLAFIVILSCGIPSVNGMFTLVAQFQHPAEPVSLLDTELGYPCYVPSPESWMEKTVVFIGRDIRAYVDLVATAFLALLGVVTLVARYKGHGGRLVLVICRDGGLHYLALLVVRMVSAIIRTPAVVAASELGGSPVYITTDLANTIIIPILAQRLLINMRQVDYMGSQPIASKLLFAPAESGSDGDLEGDFDSLEMAQESSGLRQRGSTGEGAERGEAGALGSNV